MTMYGLIKIANEQKENSALSTTGNAALAAGGAGAIAASHDRLLGRKKIFHGVSAAEAEEIRRAEDGFGDLFTPALGKENPLSDNRKDARQRANLHGDPIYASNQRNAKRASKLGREKMDEGLDIYKDLKARALEDRPGFSSGQRYEYMMGLPEAEQMDAIDSQKDKLYQLNRQFQDSADRRYQQLLSDPSQALKNGEVLEYNLPFTSNADVLHKRRFVDIDASQIVGGKYDMGYGSRLKESLQLMPDYIRKHPGRFGSGAGLAGAGLTGVGLAAHNQLRGEG